MKTHKIALTPRSTSVSLWKLDQSQSDVIRRPETMRLTNTEMKMRPTCTNTTPRIFLKNSASQCATHLLREIHTCWHSSSHFDFVSNSRMEIVHNENMCGKLNLMYDEEGPWHESHDLKLQQMLQYLHQKMWKCVPDVYQHVVFVLLLDPWSETWHHSNNALSTCSSNILHLTFAFLSSCVHGLFS